MIKLLFLDDDELTNELVVLILELAGINDYYFCTSGENALAYLEQCSKENNFPDVIFVDINMPGMDGFEFIRHYEKDYMELSPRTRVIMLSNSVLANEKKQAMQHKSVYGFWNKPLTEPKLKELIDSINASNQQ